MKKNICIHGHFYQPPRENPWTGEVDAEESAAPFHDWNERIAAECYEPNTRAPILNAQGEVSERVNNFRNISFDIGPTLLSWLRRKMPATYAEILAADRESHDYRGGHGNAMAQVYNHVILPLASARDKETQVVWGIRDFEFHYGRKPEGMWLSETAVDVETLDVLAANGILFTVLAPHQAKRVRRVGFGERWHYIHHEGIDTRQSYRILLSRGRQFNVFFYEGAISRAIAFQGLLFNGDQLAQRLTGAFSHRDRPQIVSTATDGETFGHHHKLGEMAVAYAVKKIEAHRLARVTNYAAYLDQISSIWEVDVHDKSSWSCTHGVERWRSDCGCRINTQGNWNQKWRTVLRDAFDFVKEVVDEVYEHQTGPFLRDPWLARNDYIEVLLDGSEKSRKRFVAKESRRPLNLYEERRLWDLLEAQRFAMYMYTSCGWFFDDISGIEPVQVMKFALRAIELVQPHHSKNIEEPFVKILRRAKSNIPEQGTGEEIFYKYVKPLSQAAAAQLARR